MPPSVQLCAWGSTRGPRCTSSMRSVSCRSPASSDPQVSLPGTGPELSHLPGSSPAESNPGSAVAACSGGPQGSPGPTRAYLGGCAPCPDVPLRYVLGVEVVEGDEIGTKCHFDINWYCMINVLELVVFYL